MPRAILGSATAVGVLVAASVLNAQQQAQFLMPMYDDKGAPVATFSPSDLGIFEDGKPAKVLKVEPKIVPMRVILAIDNGRGMSDVLVHVRREAKEFFNALPDGVEIALITTAPQPRFTVKPTKERADLIKRIDTVAPDSSGGRFIEALQYVGDTWKKASDATSVLVILGSTFSPEFINKGHLEDGLAQLSAARATVHVVMFKPPNATEGDAQLEVGQIIASQTRGRFESIASYLQLGIIPEIAKEVAKTAGSGQFLITIERPAGATGRLGSLSMSPSGGLIPGRITRLP
jgi:hypothetical protein